jgi:energy-coupling factor transporter ATP-binding protein EcfA2
MAEPSAIVIEKLAHYYGSGALRKQISSTSTEIEAGEIVIVTGPRGPGRRRS